MTSSTRSTRIMSMIAIAAGVPASAGAADVADASAALTFWMAWGLIYLAIAVVLMALATATALREERAWTSLLRWTAEDEREVPQRAGRTSEPGGAQRAA